MNSNCQQAPLTELSIVIPLKDEVGNLESLIKEITLAAQTISVFEIICVDDGSKDNTRNKLSELQKEYLNLRIFYHERCKGQSAAIVTGIIAAKGKIIVTIDGDGQNDPADIPYLYARFLEENDFHKIMIVGWRKNRRDSWSRKICSKLANTVRSSLLADATPDTGCGLKIFSRQSFLEMPHFDHMHRFLPALMIRSGGRVCSLPVNHRAREFGTSKYGIFNRLWVGIVDLMGVAWLIRRPIFNSLILDKKNILDEESSQ